MLSTLASAFGNLCKLLTNYMLHWSADDSRTCSGLLITRTPDCPGILHVKRECGVCQSFFAKR